MTTKAAAPAKSGAKHTSDTAAPAERFPELRVAFNALQAEKAKIVEKATPLREQRDALVHQASELERKAEALRQKIEAIEHPRLPQLDVQIAALARAMGGRRMSEGGSA